MDDPMGLPGGFLSVLSDFQHSLEAELREPSRNLLVKDLMVAFDASTVYGNRAAFMKGLVVTAACPKYDLSFS